MKIIAIAGSLRKDSLNRQLALTAKKYLEGKAEVELLDYGQVPLFNEDIEFPTPKSVEEVREKVKSADGIWFFTPEYNHFFSGVLKNLIDWLSRPVSADGRNVLAGKSTAFSGISIGGGATLNAQDHLVTLLSFLDMNLMNNPRLAIPNAPAQTQDKNPIPENSMKYLEKQADAFVKFINNKEI